MMISELLLCFVRFSGCISLLWSFQGVWLVPKTRIIFLMEHFEGYFSAYTYVLFRLFVPFALFPGVSMRVFSGWIFSAGGNFSHVYFSFTSRTTICRHLVGSRSFSKR